MAKQTKSADRTTEYAKKVVAGKILTGKLVRLACQRHLDDLKTGKSRGLYFDKEAAERRLNFYQLLKHSKGEWAGCVFEPELWQCFIQGCIFGWKRKDGLRRFRVAYEELARKNGKTTDLAGTGLYGLIADGEAGAEIYSAATKRDQARISHSEATRMVKKSPALRDRIKVFRDNLHIENSASKYEPLGADADTMDGLNPHFGLIDEYHAHKNSNVFDVIETGMGSRRQPLQFVITTAGADPLSPCGKLHEYAERILKGLVVDDTFFAYIATLDEKDDWQDEKVWIKANPNLGVSVKLDDLKRQRDKAISMPSAQNAFMRLRCNVWTQQETRWLDMKQWRKCGEKLFNEHELKDVVAYGGMDLSQKIDLSAFVLLFPIDDEVRVLPFFWLPEDRAKEEPWRRWAKDGHIKLTPGNSVDFDFIEQDIVELRKRFTFEEIAFDPWTAHQTAVNLSYDHGFTMAEVRQGYNSLSEPSKELEKLVADTNFNHGGNPVLTFMADAVSIRSDENGNIRPVKDKSSGRIDGIVASIMALDRVIRHRRDTVYTKRGIRVV